MWLNLFKLSYSQDLAGQRAFMALVQGTPFGLAGLGNFLCLVYQTQLNLLITFVAISLCILYSLPIPPLGKLRACRVNFSTGWQCDHAWVDATVRVVMVTCCSRLQLMAGFTSLSGELYHFPSQTRA